MFTLYIQIDDTVLLKKLAYLYPPSSHTSYSYTAETNVIKRYQRRQKCKFTKRSQISTQRTRKLALQFQQTRFRPVVNSIRNCTNITDFLQTCCKYLMCFQKLIIQYGSTHQDHPSLLQARGHAVLYFSSGFCQRAFVRKMASLDMDDAQSNFDVATSLFIQCRMAHQELQRVASKEGKLLNRTLAWTCLNN